MEFEPTHDDGRLFLAKFLSLSKPQWGMRDRFRSELEENSWLGCEGIGTLALAFTLGARIYGNGKFSIWFRVCVPFGFFHSCFNHFLVWEAHFLSFPCMLSRVLTSSEPRC